MHNKYLQCNYRNGAHLEKVDQSDYRQYSQKSWLWANQQLIGKQ